jgi:hypothetical protein
MTTASTAPPRGVKKTSGTESPQTTKEEISDRAHRRTEAPVSWYGRLLIVSMLLVAAGWEIFRWILAIITLD